MPRELQLQFLSPAEVADMLRVSTRTILRWIATGALNATRLGRQWRVDQADLKKFLEEQKRKGAQG